MNTDGSRSTHATADQNYPHTSGLGMLSPPSPALRHFSVSLNNQPQYVSSVGRVTNLSPSPPDYYSSLSAFTQPISATATGPLPVPIFATQPQNAVPAPFIPPTPASASGSGLPLSRQHLAVHTQQFGQTYSNICDLSSPSAHAGSDANHRGLLAPVPHGNPTDLRHPVDQLTYSLGRFTEHTNERDLYAADLVEQMIETLFRIWPDHRDPDEPSSPVMAPAVVTQMYPSGGFDPRFRSVQQQATPESSPDMVMGKNRKRKRATVTNSAVSGAGSSMDDGPRLTKRRSITTTNGTIGTAPRNSVQVSLPSVNTGFSALPLPHQATSTITLRIFCWELLRRSRTAIPTLEVAICYLDGVEDQVKELRDSYLNGAVDFDCGSEMMNSRRRVYDEALRDRGRIIKMKDLLAQEKSLKVKAEALRRERSWRPLSPPDVDGISRYSPLAFQSTPPYVPIGSTSTARDITDPKAALADSDEALQIKREILSSHPLLDPRRTLLASLVLATKFLQDRAYSNRAWAKLSGLPGHEVGRCERALGGALGWRLWVGKATGSSGTGGNQPPSPVSEASSFTMSDSNSTMSSGEPEADDGSNDPVFLKLISDANTAASQRSSSVPTRSASLPQPPQVPSVPSARAMSWPQLPGGSTLDFLQARQNPLLGDYSSVMQSAHTFDASAAPTPLPIPPPPNATVINSSGTWFSSFVCPQYLVDQKTASSLEDARRILGDDGIDQFAVMAGYSSDSPLEHPVFASTSKAPGSGSGGLGGADCNSPSTPPFVHAWNSTHASGSQPKSSSADIDGLNAFSDYWMNGDGLMPATYIPTSPLTITAAGTIAQHDVDDISMASFRRQDSIMSTPGSTVYGISRTSTLVADPADQIMDCSGVTKEKSDEMMAAITNGFGSTTISSKYADLWATQINEHSTVPQVI